MSFQSKYTKAKGKRALHWLKKKGTYVDAAKVMGIHKETLKRWIKRYEEEGTSSSYSPRGEKTSRIRDYLIKHPKASLKEFVKATGVEVAHATFSEVKSKLRNGNNAGKLVVDSLNHTQVLEDENSFLKWALHGERRGYVDRILKELSR